jgi:hypothetical protein
VEFFDSLITMDECWVYHYDPEPKEMSKQWKHADSPPQKKAKSQPPSPLEKMCGLAGGICREGLTYTKFLAPVSLFLVGDN